MSDNRPRPGSNRVRQLLTAFNRIPRRLRAAGLAGLITLGGAAALVAVPAAANAATVTNPNCPLPATVVWQETGSVTGTVYGGIPIIRITISDWQTTYNGVEYTGVTQLIGSRQVPPNEVDPTGQFSYAYCTAE